MGRVPKKRRVILRQSSKRKISNFLRCRRQSRRKLEILRCSQNDIFWMEFGFAESARGAQSAYISDSSLAAESSERKISNFKTTAGLSPVPPVRVCSRRITYHRWNRHSTLAAQS